MATPDTFRYTRIPLAHGSGAIPAVGFGTLIPDPVVTRQATQTALEVGFRHFDCAERYRNEEAVGDAMQAAFKAGTVRREDVFALLSCGTAIIVPSGSSPRSTVAVGDCKWTTSIATSSIPLLPSNRATSRTRGTSVVR